MTYKISEDIFLKCPDYIRVIIITPIKNMPSPDPVKLLLNEVKKNLPFSVNHIAEHEHIASWRKAFREFGINPTDFRPSFEALLRRSLNTPDSVKSINCAVDLGTITSIKYQVAVGVHPINNDMNIELKCATGEEKFLDFSGDTIENPKPGEVILTLGNQVLTRRWIWRQSKESIITLQTNKVFVNIDFLSPFSASSIAVIAREVGNLFGEYCSGNAEIYYLSKNNPFINCTIA